MTSSRGWISVVLVAAAVASGCATDRDAAVHDAVSRFYAAVSSSDGATACELLSPGSRDELESSSGASCPVAVLEEVDGSPAEPVVTVYGDAARARVGTDTVFLAEYDEGWRITAAGCVPPASSDEPYECRVQGG